MPSSWNHALILPIPKPDKPASDPASYRPISLCSCICKVMERLATNRLTWKLENEKILNTAQAGFRKERCTLGQIIKLQDTINKYNNNKGFTVGVFLDFEKAYDMLWRSGVVAKIKKLGINGNMFAFINNFLNNRTFQVVVRDKVSKVMELENGTPQGSSISPILFLIMINDLCINNNNVQLSLFADDSALYKSGHNLDLLIKHIQESLDRVQTWCDTWGFKLSPTKSCGVVFSNKRKFVVKKPLLLAGVPLPMEKKVKFLGLIFDCKLSWSEHINYVFDKCKRKLNLLRSLSGTSYGASKRCLLTIYRTLIRSLMDYRAIAYDSATKSTKAKLDGRYLPIRAPLTRAKPVRAKSARGYPMSAGSSPRRAPQHAVVDVEWANYWLAYQYNWGGETEY